MQLVDSKPHAIDQDNPRARLIAYYLPQYHPIPENNDWWGKGFTEWTNVAKAKPLYRGHWQPRLPADLGFYDLRVPEVRELQAEMARNHGIEGFCYYHYWFGDGRRLLERPFDEVLSSGKPDLPFTLCWANHTWSGIWYGAPNRILMEQRYPGDEDHLEHFNFLLRAFSDDRYVKVDGKPVFQILLPLDLPNVKQTTDLFREFAHNAGLKGLYLVAGYYYPGDRDPSKDGFDAVVSRKALDVFNVIPHQTPDIFRRLIGNRYFESGTLQKLLSKYYLRRFQYRDVVKYLELDRGYPHTYFPCVLSNWDNTPRSGLKGVIVEGSTPEVFRDHLQNAVDFVQREEPEKRIVFVKSWNEWAEGNYIEPDDVFGLKYLEAIKETLIDERLGQIRSEDFFK